MKYFLKILIVLVVAVAILVGVYFNTHDSANQINKNAQTTVSKQPATEKNGDKELLASLTNDKIFLYKSGDTVILNYNGKQYEYTNWSKNIALGNPEIYYADFDGDKNKEIVIRAVDRINPDTKEPIYGIYYLENDAKTDTLKVLYSSEGLCSKLTGEICKVEISQLKFSKKLIQIAMNYYSDPAKYDRATGITTNGVREFCKAIQDDNGKYLTIDSWSSGDEKYNVTSDNIITVDIPVNATYKETKDAQYVGDIHFELTKTENGELFVKSGTLCFNLNQNYAVLNPTNYAKTKWSYTERNNVADINNTDTNINQIRHKLAYDSTINVQTIPFTDSQTDIANIGSVTVTESYAELVSKKGCTFNDSYKKGEFSVIIQSNGKSYDIAYDATVTTNKDSTQTLKINFERPFEQEEINSIEVIYGNQ